MFFENPHFPALIPADDGHGFVAEALLLNEHFALCAHRMAKKHREVGFVQVQQKSTYVAIFYSIATPTINVRTRGLMSHRL